MSETVEISKDTLEQLQMAYNLQKSLYDDDNSRESYEAALKKKFPEKYKTTSEKAETYLSPLKRELEELRAWKKSMEEEKQDTNFSESFKRLKSDNGYTDEGIEEIKKIMVDRKVADPEVAAAYFEKRNPPKAIESTGYGERGWNFNDGADEKGSEIEGWFKDGNRMFDKVAAEEFGKTKRKTA